MLFAALPLDAEPAVARNEKVLEVSRIGESKEKRALLWQLWESLQTTDNEAEGRFRSFTVDQAAGKDGDYHVYLGRFGSTRCAMFLKAADLTENRSVCVRVVADGVYDYTSVVGASRRVPKYRQPIPKPDPAAPTKAEMTEKLKAGTVFHTRILKKNGCRKCSGDGKLGSMKGNAECHDCNGTGESLECWAIKW